MATDFDEYLAAVLDEPAEAAQTVFPRHAGSMIWGVRRMIRGNSIERGFKTSNLLAVTAGRVLIFPQHLARGTGLKLEPAILDWRRTDVQATGEKRCHTFTGDSTPMEGQNSDYVLVSLQRGAETVQLEVHRKGHQKIIRALDTKLTGAWT
jgi:hypothetical protein